MTSRERLPSSQLPFEWALPSGGDFQATRALVDRYRDHVRSVGVVPVDGSRQPGSLRTPLVDLGLGPRVAEPWLPWQPAAWFPARWISSIAAGAESSLLTRGAVLRFEGHCRNPGLTGHDTLVWSEIGPDGVDVAFLWSADDLAGGSHGVLSTDVIVPLGHPMSGDDGGADRLVHDLQAIRVAFDVGQPSSQA
jgi:hypothetical protein